MSQDSEEIKTIEQWRWSEMQGLELLPTSSTPPETTTPPPQEQQQIQEQELGREKESRREREKKREMEGSEGKRDGEKKPGPGPPTTGFGDLFRFADGLDYVLMGIGTVGAVVHGSSLPIFLRFFADLVNSFGSNSGDIDKMTQEVTKVLQNKFPLKSSVLPINCCTGVLKKNLRPVQRN